MKRKNRKNEQGVALIFAISIVGLMMMLAITYSALSVTNRDVAQNTSALFAARLLAENGVLRVKKVLDAYANNFSTKGTYAQIIHLRSKGEPDNSATEKDDDLQKLLTSVRRNLFYDAANDTMNKIIEQSFTYPDPSLAPKWQFIRDTTGKIVGRFAFTTYKPFGLLDLMSVSTTNAITYKTVQGKILQSDFYKLKYREFDLDKNEYFEDKKQPLYNNMLAYNDIPKHDFFLFNHITFLPSTVTLGRFSFPYNSIIRPYSDWQSLLARTTTTTQVYHKAEISDKYKLTTTDYKFPFTTLKVV